jgi:hypothetical protein
MEVTRMASEQDNAQAEAAIEALRQITDAVIEVAERMFGLQDGTVARC